MGKNSNSFYSDHLSKLIFFKLVRGSAACPRAHLFRGGVHPGHLTNPSQPQIRPEKMQNLSFLQLRSTNQCFWTVRREEYLDKTVGTL